MLLLTVSGVLIWRAYFGFDVNVVRLAVVVHAAVAALMIALIMVHVTPPSGSRDDPCHVVRHRHPRLGQTAPPRVVP